MNYKKILVIGCVSALMISIVALQSCRRSKITDAEIEAVSDNADAQGSSSETQTIADQAFAFGKSSGNMRTSSNYSTLSGCATISIDTANSSNTDTLTIDFGSSPCQCKDGRYRQGKIIVVYSDRYHTPGAIIDIYHNGYAVGKSTNDMKTFNNSSTKHIVNNGFNSSGFMSWNVTSNISFTKANGGGTVTFSESKLRTQIAGLATGYSTTNKYSVSGSANGTAANGTSFTANTVAGNDLIRDMSCAKHFTQGALEITPSGKSKVTIDFGNGTCDNTATVTRNGKTKTITLR
ncbi:MAG: hypothetical protein RL065_1943 [Bacteroidota bacterium]|jgi:hypothetical protein